MRCRVIHASFAPTVSWGDAVHATRLLTRPAHWRFGETRRALQRELAARLGVPADRILALDSGRNALRLALQLLGVGKGDDVALQAFTCVSVPGPVLWVGARPVYVDIEPATFTMDPADLERKLTPHTKAIIVQHTFGLPADLEAILRIAQTRGIAVIEDCAHALGAAVARPQGSTPGDDPWGWRKVGTFGDAAIFSCGRDKVISSVFGGALIVNRAEAAVTLSTLDAQCATPPAWWIARQLLHTVLAPTIRATYYCGGRELLRLALATNALSKAITQREKWGGQPSVPPSVLTNALAARALHQLRRLDAFQERRAALAQHYTESLADLPGVTLPASPPGRTHAWLRYAVRVPHREAIHAAACAAGIALRDPWYDSVVAPRSCDLRALHYTEGSCPEAERAAREVVNLPTSPTLGIPAADRVLRVVRHALTADPRARRAARSHKIIGNTY